MTLHIKVQFKHELSDRAQADLKRIIADFRESLEYVSGKVVQADLVSGEAPRSPEEAR